MTEYAAPIAPRVVVISVVVHLLVLVLVARGVRGRLRRAPTALGRRVAIATALLPFAVFLVVDLYNYRRSPTAYLLTDEALTVRTRVSEIPFAWDHFDRVDFDRRRDWQVAYNPWFYIQLQGRISRGPFGISGVTRPPGRSWVNVYVTDPGRVVVLEGRLNLVVSPAEPNRFVRDVRRRLRRRQGDNVGAEPADAESGTAARMATRPRQACS